MLVESGNGLGENGTNGLTKKKGNLINEQVESLLESKDFSIYQDDYTLADRELMAALYWSWWKRISWWRGCWPFKRILYSSNSIDKLWQIAGRLMPNAETAFEPSAGIGKIINSSPC